MNKNNRKKWIVDICIFTAIMALTFWSIFRNQDFAGMAASVQKLSIPSAAAAVALAMAFVAGEGCMIWYLLKGIGEKTGLCRCISYSFIGFFFSGITPSATGGQPMQLYYMRKGGNSLSSASAALMTVAVAYKFVLVITGTGLLLFWRQHLRRYLQGYYRLYFLGLFLNAVLVILLLLVMFSPEFIRTVLLKTEELLVHLKIRKRSDLAGERINQFIAGYQGTVDFLRHHKKMIGVIVAGTFLQRFSVFFLTYVVYRGLGLHGSWPPDIVLLQASVYIAVDMLPVPGAQGITEAMYRTVFKDIFRGSYLVASMCVTRGISFYFIMILSLFVFLVRHFRKC